MDQAVFSKFQTVKKARQCGFSKCFAKNHAGLRRFFRAMPRICWSDRHTSNETVRFASKNQNYEKLIIFCCFGELKKISLIN
jgi:hypothetical protein